MYDVHLLYFSINGIKVKLCYALPSLSAAYFAELDNLPDFLATQMIYDWHGGMLILLVDLPASGLRKITNMTTKFSCEGTSSGFHLDSLEKKN